MLTDKTPRVVTYDGETDKYLASSATFDRDFLHRYVLTRRWAHKPCSRVAFICLNPSKADHLNDDATVRKCVGFAKHYGFGELVLVNLFAYRGTNPREMKEAYDPVGPANLPLVRAALYGADRVFAAWGNHGRFEKQDAAT